ncbi:MAG TPA: hypothetical protein VFA99_01690 [Acidobacteriaceae bacterium]|nr:hypothetical protein [Acidobacteriaceae bacterium]
MSATLIPVTASGSATERAITSEPVSLLSRVFSRSTLFCCVLAAVVYMCVPQTFSDPDIGWHLRDAEILVSSHHMIRRDVFSFTAAGAPWINHEWMAELPFYAAWRLGGLAGVHTLTLIVIGALMFGIYGLSFTRSRDARLSLAVSVVATIFSTVSFGPRTLLFGWLLFLAELAILQRALSTPRAVWLMPLLLAIWVNTHGSWMIGLVVYAVFVAANAVRWESPWLTSPGMPAAQIRTYIGSGLASVAALFLNPYGWRLVTYPFNLAFHQRLNIANVEEWRTLDLHTGRGKFALGCVIALATWQIVRPHRWTLTDVALMVIGFYSGFTYSRFLFLFAILGAPIVAGTFATCTPSQARTQRPLLNAACILVVAALVFTRLHHPPTAYSSVRDSIPESLPAVFASLPPNSRVLNEYAWGGALILHQPNVPVFIDSRVDIFEYNGTLKDYLDIVHLHRTLDLLDRYRITHAIFPPDAPLIYFLEHTGSWKVLYQDKHLVLLKRRPGLS